MKVLLRVTKRSIAPSTRTTAFPSTCALLLSYGEDVQWLFTSRKKVKHEMFENLRIPTYTDHPGADE
jgi:hypothetical protein